MRALKIIIAAWLLGMLALWIRGGQGFCITETLPFVHRQQPFSNEYELQAVLAVLMGVWGVWMLSRQSPKTTVPASGQGRFRSEIILVPLGIIALAAISQRITAGRTFSDVIGNPPRSTEHAYLAVLAVVVFGIVLAFKFSKNR
jgi:hypothetical protein